MSSEHQKVPGESQEEEAAAESLTESPSDKTEEVINPLSECGASTSLEAEENEESTKHWPSDHAVTTEAEETDKTEDEKLFDSSRDMFHKVSDYLNGELTMTLEDYTLLEKLNKMSTGKFSDMSVMAQQLHTTMEELNKKCNDLKPYLDQIDRIEKSVSNLESEAHKLDAYSKRLETKFKKLEKR